MTIDTNSKEFKSNWLLSSMPDPLRDICTAYMRDRCLPSFSYAIKELLETHPEIAKRINAVYDEQDRAPRALDA